MKGPLSKYFGPSTLVAAAFIGPGTVTTCTMAGVNSGYTLLWAMIFSIIATVVLQEMAARLGWITRQGLGEAIAKQFPSGVEKGLSIVLVLGAIVIGLSLIHISEPTRPLYISYAVFCLKKKK